MPNLACFDSVTLQDYLLGKLPDEQSDVISTHLERCLSCEATISQLDRASDTLTNGLRLNVAASGSPPTSNANLQQVLSRVPSLERAADSSARSSSQQSTSQLSKTPLLRDYRLLEPIGSGGMGQVFKAVHTRLDRLVAVKLLPARRLGDEQAVARFQREMRVIGQLSHPAIVQATDAGEVDGTHFLVMEFVEGFDLNTIAKACGPLSIADACEIARQAALGLEYAHQQGIVHRDIKPSNLMLSVVSGPLSVATAAINNGPRTTDNGPTLKILDLGLALLSGEQAPVDELTTVGQLMGTLDYMAPEQLEDSHLVGPRADVYALAATLFRLLTGAAPFAKDDRKTPLQKLRALATLTAPPIRERRADLPEELAAIIDRALRRDPAERFASMTEFATALAPWCAGHDLAQLSQLAVQADWVARPEALRRAWSVSASPIPATPFADSGRATPSSAREGSLNTRVPLPAFGHPLPKGEGTRSRRTLIATLLTIIGFVALGIVIAIETNKGRLIVESVRDGVEVRLKKSGRVVDQLEVSKTAKSTKLAAGEYEIELVGEADGLKIDRNNVVVTRGDVVVAKVVEIPKGQAVTNIPAAGAGLGTETATEGVSPLSIPTTTGGNVALSSDADTEPADEKPNPNAKSIDQWLAESPDARSEAKFREAMRRKIDVDFNDQPLTDVVAFCSDQVGLSIWVDGSALTEEGIANDTPITFRLSGSSLESALILMLRPFQLRHEWDGTSVRITTVAKANERLVNRSYPIGRSLPMVRKVIRLANEQSLATHNAILQAGGRPVSGQPGGGSGGGFFRVPELDLSTRLHFQFGGGGFGGGGFGGGGGDAGGGAGVNGALDHNGVFHPLQMHTVASYYSTLLELMTSGRWQLSDGEGGTLQLVGDVLLIRQTQQVHDQIVSALRLLEQAAAGPLPQSPVEIRRPDYPLAADELLRKKLSQPAEINQNDSPLTDAISFLEDFSQVRILLDTEKLTEEGIASDATVTLTLTDVPLEVVLRRLLDPLQLAAYVEEGVLIITTKTAITERQSLKAYDVRDLLGRGVEQQDLINALFATTGPWMDQQGEGGELMIFAERLLFVSQTHSNHAEIDEVLRRLRSQLSDQLPKAPLAKRFPKAPATTPAPAKPAPQPAPATPKPPTNAARYDGKTFDDWLAVLETERSPARLKEAIQALLRLKNDSQDQLIAKRFFELNRHDYSQVFPLTNGGVTAVIEEIVNAMKPNSVSAALDEELRHGNTVSRRFAFAVLRTKPDFDLRKTVVEVSRDGDSTIRLESIRWLTRWIANHSMDRVDPNIHLRLRYALADKETEIRLAAAKGLLLADVDTQYLIDVLIKTIADDQPIEFRVEAAKFLAALGPRAAIAVPVLTHVLKSEIAKYEETKDDENPWPSNYESWRLGFHGMTIVALIRMGPASESALPVLQQFLPVATNRPQGVGFDTLSPTTLPPLVEFAQTTIKPHNNEAPPQPNFTEDHAQKAKQRAIGKQTFFETERKLLIEVFGEKSSAVAEAAAKRKAQNEPDKTSNRGLE